MNHKPTENDKAKSLSLDRLHQYRHAQGQNQSEFWGRFGVTQSGGSQYENGRDVPEPTQLLRALRHLGRIDDPDLTAARKYLERFIQGPYDRLLDVALDFRYATLGAAIALFRLWGPQDELTKNYRWRFDMALY